MLKGLQYPPMSFAAAEAIQFVSSVQSPSLRQGPEDCVLLKDLQLKFQQTGSHRR